MSLLKTVGLVLFSVLFVKSQLALLPHRCVEDGDTISCSCDYDEELNLKDVPSWLPEMTSCVTVSDCRLAKVWVDRSDKVLKSFHLQQMTFRDINELIFRSGSIDFNLPHDNAFIFNISRVSRLSLERGSVRLSGAPSAIIVNDASMPGLPMFAIESSSLKLLKLHGIVFTRPLSTSAVVIESSDTVIDINEVNARGGLESGWVHGRIASLAIQRSRLLLYPDAFSRLSFSDASIKTFSLRENILLVANNSTPVPTFLSKHQEKNLWVRINKNKISCQLPQPENEEHLTKLTCYFYSTSICLEPNRTVMHPSKCSAIETDKPSRSNSKKVEDFFLSITL